MKTKRDLKYYLLFWSTQSLSTLGSGMTGYALTLWLYLNSGSALKTALLSVCSYAPYVLMSMFAGALSDRWDKKKTILACDLFAAACTVSVLALIRTNSLEVWHLYFVNALSGLMNTVQQPASEVAATLLIPKEYYQKTSGLRSFSQSLNSILMPVAATALFGLAGMEGVIVFDLATFAVAFVCLWLFIRLPAMPAGEERGETVLLSVRRGLAWLKGRPLILRLILFLACINLIASVYDAALPAMVLSRQNEAVLGAVNACVGLATLLGSAVVLVLPAPKNRVRAICAALLISMSTENFLLAFSASPVVWCAGAALGWISIPFMNANMDVIFRSEIPPQMQGRVYSCRNALQFFTIPLGFLTGGLLVDQVFEPLMASQGANSPLPGLFGFGKGAGAAMLFAVIGVAGVAVCLLFGALLKRYTWSETD